MTERDYELCLSTLFGVLAGSLGYVLGKWHKETSFEVAPAESHGFHYDIRTGDWKPAALQVSLLESYKPAFETETLPVSPSPVPVVSDPQSIMPESPPVLSEDEIDIERFERMG